MAQDLHDVIQQMRAHGLAPPPSVDLSVAFSRYLRFRPDGDKRNKKSAWARLFEYRSPANGSVYITGIFGNRGERWDVEATGGDWSPAERAAELLARREAAKAAEGERAKDAATAAAKAGQMWKRSRDFDPADAPHPYLEHKRVGAFGVRRGFNNRVLVPLRDVNGALHGLQYISPDGAKLFGTGTAKDGRGHLIGQVDADAPIAFGEGYATCASAHMATSWPVVVCFDAGNLDAVMAAWRKLYPKHRFVVAADDDRHLLQRLCERLAKHGIACTPSDLAKGMDLEWQVPGGPLVKLRAGWKGDGAGGPMRIDGSITVDSQAHLLKIENAGLDKGVRAARRYKAILIAPRFVNETSAGTDFNDVHCEQGIAAVREQLLAGLEAGAVPKGRASASARAPRDPAAGIDEPTRMSFLERYTLIYGTTTVWDAQERRILRLEALKVAYGRLVDWWLQHPDRPMVAEDHVVFDPTGHCRPPEYVNLFDKLPLEPGNAAQCPLIVAHLWNICQENEALFHWVACWLALPLQRPGAKMRTALVLHGRTEGTGKTLLTDCVRGIYGRYAMKITQLQLQTEFTGWLSGKLFFVAEEVVSRQDRTHHKGLLQELITGDVVNINEKNMPLRTERNHGQFVFQSNDQLPMLLNPRDRRHTVIRCDREHPPDYFDAIRKEMNAGGLESFYAWLLAYDVGEFNEFTRPFENRDRMHLIALGMSPDERFFEFWRSGLAGVPFCCAPALDLYSAFKGWCRISGERFVPNSTAFGRTMAEALERLKAPPKRQMRFLGFSNAAIVEGDFSADVSKRQGVVYFVPHAIERLSLDGNDGDEPPPPAEPVDVTLADELNKRIKLFQAKLHELLASARRGL